MKAINLEINDGDLIHIWTGAMGKVMVANYDNQTLLSFDTLDDAVNHLWLSGNKQAARQLNGVKK
jgi:hypothetical protein